MVIKPIRVGNYYLIRIAAVFIAFGCTPSPADAGRPARTFCVNGENLCEAPRYAGGKMKKPGAYAEE
jgi:hypothetical protein